MDHFHVRRDKWEFDGRIYDARAYAFVACKLWFTWYRHHLYRANGAFLSRGSEACKWYAMQQISLWMTRTRSNRQIYIAVHRIMKKKMVASIISRQACLLYDKMDITDYTVQRRSGFECQFAKPFSAENVSLLSSHVTIPWMLNAYCSFFPSHREKTKKKSIIWEGHGL